jgi:hypothetical protein
MVISMISATYDSVFNMRKLGFSLPNATGVARMLLPVFAACLLLGCGGGKDAASQATTTTVAVNHAPTLSGSPAVSVVANQAYAFTPSASDPDGNSLSFSIQNKPSWASFSISTGALTGTPSSANVGTYSNILVGVSDGTNSVSLTTFNITVMTAGTGTTGTANLQWVAPTQNSDGTALTNLAGFRIYYGTSSSSLSQSVTVNSTSATNFAVTGLATGTWYFAVKSYNTAGAESALSSVVSKAI